MWSKVVGGASLPTPFLAFRLSQTQATTRLGKLCLAHGSPSSAHHTPNSRAARSDQDAWDEGSWAQQVQATETQHGCIAWHLPWRHTNPATELCGATSAMCLYILL